MRIGFRTAKTVVAVVLAIYIANALHLKLAEFTGIVAALLLKNTRKETVVTAGKTVIALFFTLAVDTLLFSLLGFHVYVIGLILLLLIPILVRTKTERSVVLGTVITIHVYTAGHLDMDILLNEIWLILTGMTVSLTINWLYMPSRKEQLLNIHRRLELAVADVFDHFARALEEKNYLWDGAEILTIHNLIQQGKKEALLHEDNYITSDDVLRFHHFEKKEKQYERIKHMLALVSRVDQVIVQGKMLASILRKMSETLRSGADDFHQIQEEIRALRETCEDMPLPKTRKEFEIRAALLQMLNELEGYILDAV
ncbi:aromatic acid exporter family protein [Polycladomyces sp. WAk]|uniref:Aromatic acid exporter family protein n=1 Tax=Polycladomyces zharkentensis TaxID=2807616 RepID=A0ABS2WN81_9BACL|nr:aromatic acid exporter family protein [Polycladomyces sp. WAk]MBN2910931.1 aromatic acid exporter family protein [Polycladomyces sp. WAk]